MSREPLVPEVEAVLLRIANGAREWETVGWCAAVAECFDGGDFDVEYFGDLRYRLEVLRDRTRDVADREWNALVEGCQAVLDSPRTRERNNAVSCGNLRLNDEPVRHREPAQRPGTAITFDATARPPERG